MNIGIDLPFSRGGASQSALAESPAMDHEHIPGNAASNAPVKSEILVLLPSNTHSSRVTDAGITTQEEQGPIQLSKPDEEPSDTRTARNVINHESSCLNPPSCSDQASIMISKEVLSSEHAVVPMGDPTFMTDINNSEPFTIDRHLEVPELSGTELSATTARDEKEPDLVDPPNHTQIFHAELDRLRSVGLDRLTDEEETRERLGITYDDLPSSLPPSSSPPQLLSSSPHLSSQSSESVIEPSKVPTVEAEDYADCLEGPRGDVSLARGESKESHGQGIADVATSPGAHTSSSPVYPASWVELGLQPSKKRMAYQSDPDESYELQPIKQKWDYLPPAPKRTTLASQHRQFKKLAAPFRPPLKLPGITDGPAQTESKAESITRYAIEVKSDTREPSPHAFPLQHKPTNTPRSITQFKSPLVNRVIPADTRAIRLTPAVQALERKLQLLKRAIKVKEDKEEDVLVRLAAKWIEAGREVAYEVWDATKDVGGFNSKAVVAYRLHGWESTGNAGVPWGWDSEPRNTSEESGDRDPSQDPDDGKRLNLEEDEEDVRRNTLGTMLRQLGIAPEIFGWEEDKEAFSD